MPKEIKRKKIIVGVVGIAALVGGVSGGAIAIAEIEVQSEEDKEKLKIFNWSEAYGAVVSLLNVSNEWFICWK